jgi:hypothetical protein
VTDVKRLSQKKQKFPSKEFQKIRDKNLKKNPKKVLTRYPHKNHTHAAP